MASTLGYVILAMLASKPQSGYDLARQMKPPMGYLWQARHSQIYPELARLAKSGLVAFQKIDKRSGPPRRVHSITPKGAAELARWVAMPPQSRTLNDELVVKAYALKKVSGEKAVAMLRDELSAHERRLASLEVFAGGLDTRSSRRPQVESPRFGEYAALRRAIGAEREYLAWCRWLISEMRAGSRPQKQARSRARGAGTSRKTRLRAGERA